MKEHIFKLTLCCKICISITTIIISSLLFATISTSSGVKEYYRWEVCLRSGTEMQYLNADANGHKGCITSNTNMTFIQQKQGCPFATKSDTTYLNGEWVNNTAIIDGPESCSGPFKHYNNQWFTHSGTSTTHSKTLNKNVTHQWNTDVCDWIPEGQVVQVVSKKTSPDVEKTTFGKVVHDTLVSSIVLNSLMCIFAVQAILSGQPVYSRRHTYWVLPWCISFIVAAVNVGIFVNIFSHLHPHILDIANNIFYAPYRLDVCSIVIFSLEAVYMFWSLIGPCAF
jgi:hypothetical protein